MTDLSIIIVCYKGWDRLYKCLDAIDSFSGKYMKSEVIIVDNNSDDETIQKIEERFSKFRFIYNKTNGGFGNGCNLGAQNADGAFILFLNPDTVPTEPAIEKLLNTAKQNPDYAIVSCRQLNEKGNESIPFGPFPAFFNLTGFQRAIFNRRLSKPPLCEGKLRGGPAQAGPHTTQITPDLCFPDWISGSVFMIRKEIFLKLRGFDEDFWMYFEDVDLCRRARNNDDKIAFSNNITIEHNHGGSSRTNLKTTSITKTEVYISRHIYISKHKTGIAKLLIQVFMIINNLISGGIMALLGLPLFFIPKAFSRTLIYFRLIKYYAGSLFRLSWIGPRSVNFRQNC